MQIRVTSYNYLNLYDKIDDPGVKDEDTPEKPLEQRQAGGQVLRELDSDVISFQEIEKGSLLKSELDRETQGQYDVVHIDGNVVANNAETVLQLAVAGVGITRLTDVIVGDAIQRGELVPILRDWHHVEPVPLYATYPSGRNLSPKIRVMVDFLVEQFGNAPWRRGAASTHRQAV